MKTANATANVPCGLVQLSVVLSLAVALVGCGGGTNTGGRPLTQPPVPPVPAAISVSVSPAVVWADQGGTRQFSAQVSGTNNPAVTWGVQEGSAGGSVSQTGLYTAPVGAMEVHVVATSVADPNKSASALVTVTPVSVTMAFTTALPRGRQRQFRAWVYGTVFRDLTWSVDDGPAGGTITADGVYTAPMSGGPFHVTARSVADPSKAATAEFVLTDAGFRMLSTSMAAPRIWHTATRLPDGKVLITGGRPCDGVGCSPFEALSSAELFDPATETFSATGSMSFKRVGHTATLLPDGKVLVIGGSSEDQGTAELYDPSTGKFTSVGTTGNPRSDHTASLLADGRVLVLGGWALESGAGSWVLTKSAQVYDPATQIFSSVADIPVGVTSHTASSLLDGSVLVAGGDDGITCPGAQSAVTIFHPNTNTFTSSTNLPDPRGLHLATVLNDGRVLITGGVYDFCIYYDVFTPHWEAGLDTAVVFDPATASYSSGMVMRERRWGHTATLLNDGTVLVVGSTADLFDPATSSFAVTGDPYGGSTDGMTKATRLSDGRVLFTGGSIAELYE